MYRTIIKIGNRFRYVDDEWHIIMVGRYMVMRTFRFAPPENYNDINIYFVF